MKRMSLLEFVRKSGNFTQFLNALKIADLTEALTDPGPVSVFAPSDDAFARIPEDTLCQIFEDKKNLQKMIALHILPDRIHTEDVGDHDELQCVDGTEVLLENSRAKGACIDGVRVVSGDWDCTNGVLHEIDRVLLPYKYLATSQDPVFFPML